MRELIWKGIFFLIMAIVFAMITSIEHTFALIITFVVCVFSYYYSTRLQNVVHQCFRYCNMNTRYYTDDNAVQRVSIHYLNKNYTKNAPVSLVGSKSIMNSSQRFCDNLSNKDPTSLVENYGSQSLNLYGGDLPSPILRTPTQRSKNNFFATQNHSLATSVSNRRANVNFDRTMMNVNSPGFASRVVNKASEIVTNHSKYPPNRQVPTSSIRPLAKIPRSTAVSNVRIAPPEASKIESLTENSELKHDLAQQQVNEPNNQKIQPMKERARKRSYSQEDNEPITKSKKVRKDEVNKVTKNHHKRAREFCDNEVEESDAKKRCEESDNVLRALSYTSGMNVLAPGEFGPKIKSQSKKRKFHSSVCKNDSPESQTNEKIRRVTVEDCEEEEEVFKDIHPKNIVETSVEVHPVPKNDVDMIEPDLKVNSSVEEKDDSSMGSTYERGSDDDEDTFRVAGGKMLNRGSGQKSACKLDTDKMNPESIFASQTDLVVDVTDKKDILNSEDKLRENLLSNIIHDIEGKDQDHSVIFYSENNVQEVPNNVVIDMTVKETSSKTFTSSTLKKTNGLKNESPHFAFPAPSSNTIDNKPDSVTSTSSLISILKKPEIIKDAGSDKVDGLFTNLEKGNSEASSTTTLIESVPSTTTAAVISAPFKSVISKTNTVSTLCSSLVTPTPALFSTSLTNEKPSASITTLSKESKIPIPINSTTSKPVTTVETAPNKSSNFAISNPTANHNSKTETSMTILTTTSSDVNNSVFDNKWNNNKSFGQITSSNSGFPSSSLTFGPPISSATTTTGSTFAFGSITAASSDSSNLSSKFTMGTTVPSIETKTDSSSVLSAGFNFGSSIASTSTTAPVTISSTFSSTSTGGFNFKAPSSNAVTTTSNTILNPSPTPSFTNVTPSFGTSTAVNPSFSPFSTPTIVTTTVNSNLGSQQTTTSTFGSNSVPNTAFAGTSNSIPNPFSKPTSNTPQLGSLGSSTNQPTIFGNSQPVNASTNNNNMFIAPTTTNVNVFGTAPTKSSQANIFGTPALSSAPQPAFGSLPQTVGAGDSVFGQPTSSSTNTSAFTFGSNNPQQTQPNTAFGGTNSFASPFNGSVDNKSQGTFGTSAPAMSFTFPNNSSNVFGSAPTATFGSAPSTSQSAFVFGGGNPGQPAAQQTSTFQFGAPNNTTTGQNQPFAFGAGGVAPAPPTGGFSIGTGSRNRSYAKSRRPK